MEDEVPSREISDGANRDAIYANLPVDLFQHKNLHLRDVS
jgi:hypothetical protein